MSSSAVDSKWHHYERVTDNWMVIPACLLAGWVACSAYYQIPTLLSEHGRLVTIYEHRNEWRQQQVLVMAAEERNARRLDTLEKQFHDMQEVRSASAKAAVKLRRR